MRAVILIFTLIVLCLVPPPLRAQDDAIDAEPGTGIVYGQTVGGQLNDRAPQAVYFFDGLRCEAIALRVTTTSGTLDPVLLVVDSAGRAIASVDDSSAAGRDPAIAQVRLPATGRYYIIVARFGYGLGTTTGRFELSVERIGPGAASLCALRYGDTILHAIDDDEPEVFYTFQASRGDIVNITMRAQSGNLDPALLIAQTDGIIIAESDDALGFSGLDARIESLFIPADGTYVVIATRYGQAAGPSSGTFLLSIAEADNSGLGNSAQAAIPLRPGEPVEDELGGGSFQRYFRFEARRDDLITLTMTRQTGTLDSFLILTNAGLQQLAANDDFNESQNSQIARYLIPADGVYYVIATRYQGEEGTTAGTFRLQLEALGNAFAAVPEGVQRIDYNLSVTGRIDDVTPETVYAFYGREGEIISISMNLAEGDLDPYLDLLSEAGSVLISDDDTGGNRNARIDRYTLPRTGVYYIRATRFPTAPEQPTTSGSYVLVLTRQVE